MRHSALIAIGALGLMVPAAPAAAEGGLEGSGNPYAVTWDGDAFARTEALTFELRDDAPSIGGAAFAAPALVQPLPFRVPTTDVLAGPSLVTQSDSSFPSCDDGSACGDVAGHLGLRVRGGASGVRLGALVRLGESLSTPRSGGGDSWRFFAAADAHALTWDFDGRDGEKTVRVEEKTLVGDAQIGVARELAGGDLALGFVHREVSFKGASRDEQFGGVTFVIAR